MREPKKIAEYLPALEAIERLEELTQAMRERYRPGDVMKWDVTFNFWNPVWKSKNAPPMFCSQARFSQGKP